MALSEDAKSKFFCVGAITLACLALIIGLIAASFADVQYYEVSNCLLHVNVDCILKWGL